MADKSSAAISQPPVARSTCPRPKPGCHLSVQARVKAVRVARSPLGNVLGIKRGRPGHGVPASAVPFIKLCDGATCLVVDVRPNPVAPTGCSNVDESAAVKIPLDPIGI